jgi:hypothetical protein
MLGVPTNFQAVSNVLPTYNFVDIISGTGYINFYAGNTVDLKLLSNFSYYSDKVSIDCANAVYNAWTKVLDIDYDVIVNRPLVLKGLAIVDVPISITSNSWNSYVIVTLRKYNGVETDIVTNTSSADNGGANIYIMKSIDLDIPLTIFKIGETLRLTVEGWFISAPGAGTLKIGCDPKNRSAGWDTTGAVPSQLMFQCPVRLNL